ncbi:GNAT family N-acetyltransferase [bacterium]|nr:MAG: GNAT family N-acetyltransferase [bacterium]
MMEPILRKARLDDRSDLQSLIAASARSLGLSEYSPAQIEVALQGAFGVDTELVLDETYFLVEVGPRIVACGGWSRREKGWGGDSHGGTESRLLDPEHDSAKIRAFFVHPDFARQGLAKRLLQRCEEEACKAGFQSCELTATLPGLPFYAALGYAAGTPFDADLGGTSIKFVPMHRSLL